MLSSPALTRFLLRLEYDGSPFCGWQRQKNGLSVQQVLEEAATQLDGQSVAVTGAGRTDAGVHAYGQTAHADFTRPLTANKLREALNGLLRPHPVAVLEASKVAPDFHARFQASARHYLYRVTDRRAPPALDRSRVWHLPGGLAIEAMQQAACALVGRHDFSTFRDRQCQADSPVRMLKAVCVSRKAAEIHLEFSADAFLHRQVRSMVGSLVEVGRGHWPPTQMAQALKAADRKECGPVAPAQGLYLRRVDYPRTGGAAK